MNKQAETPKKPLFSGKIKDILLLALLAVLLLFTAWKIFQEEDLKEASGAWDLSEKEIKVMRILEQIDGVGEASVVVCEEKDEVKSVVVVCDGAKNLQVIMDIREAVATALGTEEKSVKIYLKKE